MRFNSARILFLFPALFSPLYGANLEAAFSTHASAGSTAPVVQSSGTWRDSSNHAFVAGENLDFVVKWGLIKAGTSSLSVHGMDIVDGRPAYHLVSDANSGGMVNTFYHVHDRNDAWLDAQSLVTVRYEKRIKEGKYRIEQTGVFDQMNHRYAVHSYRLDKNTYEDKQGDLNPNVLDVLGSLYYVRTLPLVVGQSYTMDVDSGEKIWPLIVKVKKREKVKVPAGKFDCFMVEPLLREPGIFVAKGKKLEVWLTADERHLPVQMRSEVFIGHVSAELVRASTAAVSRP